MTNSRPSGSTVSRLSFAAVALVLIGKAFLARVLVTGETRWWTVVFEAVFVLAFLGVFDAVFFRLRGVGYVLADTILSLLLLMSVVYASYFGQVLTPALASLAGQVGEVGSSVTNLLGKRELLFVLDIPVLAAAMWWLRSRMSVRFDRLLAGVAAGAWVASTLLVVSVVRIPGAIDGVTAARMRGLFAYQLGSTLRHEDARAGRTQLPAETGALQARIDATRGIASSSATATAGMPAPGSAKGANVIVIQVEALQGVVIGKSIGGRPITPNFNEFAAGSYYFPNTFSQIAKGNTSDAEFVVASSLYPPLEKAASLAYADRQLTGLPRSLVAEGYRAITFHANAASFWNRTQLYPALGFSRFYDRHFFGNADVVGMGPSDEVLFAKTLGQLKTLDAQDTPFYAQIVTLTSHDPFDPMPADKNPYLPPAPYAGTSLGRYITRIDYADRAFGQFIADLKASGLYDTSVIIVYGDHFAIKHSESGNAEADAQLALLGKPYSKLERLRVPLMVHVPGQSQGATVTTPASQLDVLPTVAGLLGTETTGTVYFGRNVFSGQRPMFAVASAPLGTFINERILFSPGLGFDDGNAVSVFDGAHVSVNASDAADFESAKLVRDLSAAYIATLPKRQGPAVDPNAVVPTNLK